MTTLINKIIEKLNLQQNSAEGGYFKEIYRSDEKINVAARYAKMRNVSTSIYYLLCGQDFSAWHKIKSDEIWHYYPDSTASVTIYRIDESGKLCCHQLGKVLEGCHPQVIIPANHWMAAELNDKTPDAFALMGCTVAPGFEFNDFTLGQRQQLLSDYPEHQNLILRLTRIS